MHSPAVRNLMILANMAERLSESEGPFLSKASRVTFFRGGKAIVRFGNAEKEEERKLKKLRKGTNPSHKGCHHGFAEQELNFPLLVNQGVGTQALGEILQVVCPQPLREGYLEALLQSVRDFREPLHTKRAIL